MKLRSGLSNEAQAAALLPLLAPISRIVEELARGAQIGVHLHLLHLSPCVSDGRWAVINLDLPSAVEVVDAAALAGTAIFGDPLSPVLPASPLAIRAGHREDAIEAVPGVQRAP